MTTMPSQNPSTSKQDYETPSDFLQAVESRFGPIGVDLACSRPTQSDLFLPDNRKAPIGLAWPEVDSLSVDWASDYGGMVNWLNMPFNQSARWYAKCAEQSPRYHDDGAILCLSPASVSSNYFAANIWGRALVLAIRPRLIFVGETDGFPKDLMLVCYGPRFTPGFDLWRWKAEDRVALPRKPRRARAIVEIGGGDD
jgi:hypothetical protein